MAKRKLTLDKQEIAVLKQTADRTKDPSELKRLQAVRLYGTGQPIREIAEILDTSISNIYRWAGKYRQGGCAELKTKYGGNQNAAKLTREQRADLREKLHQYKPDETLPPDIRSSQGQFWTVSDLKVAVKNWYGVSYQSDSSYRELFHDCDFSFQRTSGRYRSRANQEKVADFEQQLEKK